MHPIGDADATRVGQFLHSRMNTRVTAEHWASSLQVPWAVDKPNCGYMLLDGDRVVGVHLAFYSEREIGGRIERFCNLGAFCVLPEYRFHSVRLLKALLAQEGYHFTDLSPSGSVVALNRRLKFRALETDVALVPNLPWPSWPGRETISSDPAVIERTLTGRELELYLDNAGGSAGRHLVLSHGDEWCYVVFRKERKRRLPLPLFANILHVSNPDLFRRMSTPLARHLLVRHGALATIAEERIVKHRPRLSYRLREPRQRMFRSTHLEPAQIDYLYSELVCVSW
jgi:hypothetical protein